MDKSKIIEIVSGYIDLNYQSESTKNTYKSYLIKFVNGNHYDSIEKLSDKYLTKCLVYIKNNRSISVYNHYVSVLKIIYQKVLKQRKLKDVNCIKQFPKLKKLPDIST